MNKVIIEIKAKCSDPERIREILRGQNARYVGKDHQVDTYFEVHRGRLKLREGKIDLHSELQSCYFVSGDAVRLILIDVMMNRIPAIRYAPAYMSSRTAKSYFA